MKLLDRWQMRASVTIVFMLFILLVLPFVAQMTESATGVSESPDTAFFYDSEELFDMAEAYGQSGRTFYIILRWTFDVAWPVVYGLFLYVMLRWIQRVLGLKLLTLFPLIGVTFDFVENVCASLVFGFYPHRLEGLAFVAPYATMVKWIGIGLSFVLIILGIVGIVGMMIKRRLEK